MPISIYVWWGGGGIVPPHPLLTRPCFKTPVVQVRWRPRSTTLTLTFMMGKLAFFLSKLFTVCAAFSYFPILRVFHFLSSALLGFKMGQTLIWPGFLSFHSCISCRYLNILGYTRCSNKAMVSFSVLSSVSPIIFFC